METTATPCPGPQARMSEEVQCQETALSRRQRSASFWATSAGTFSTSRHAPVNLIFYQKSNQAMCPHFFCASAIALRSASARFAWGRRTCNGALRSCPAPQELFAAQPSVRARAQSCRGYDAARDPDRHREHRPDDRPWRSGSRGGRHRSDQQVPQAPWHSPPRHSPPS